VLPENSALRMARIVAPDLLREIQQGQSTAQQRLIPINVLISESHERQAEVTQHPMEDGTHVSDHVILKPLKLNLMYEQTNASAGGRKTAQDAWDALQKLWTERTPFEIWTDNQIYSDMVVEHLTALQQAPNPGALAFTATLVQINYASLSYVKIPASQLAADVAQTATSMIQAGRIDPQPVTITTMPELLASLKTSGPTVSTLTPGGP
jgi:hypothetical protein